MKTVDLCNLKNKYASVIEINLNLNSQLCTLFYLDNNDIVVRKY